MKILLTDIFLRKSFDAINILRKYYPNQNLIYTLSSKRKFYFLKLKTCYNTNNFDYLAHKTFQKDLFEISKKYVNEKIVFIPFEEETTLSFFNFLKDYGNLNFIYLLPNFSTFQLARNKKELNLFCEKFYISCPKFLSESSIKDKKLVYPIIKKPIFGSGSQGIVYIYNKTQMDNCKIDFLNEFLQEKLPNASNVMAGFFLCIKGEVMSFYSHSRIRTYPKTGGVTVFSKSENNLKIKSIGSKIIKKLDWSGLVMIEFLYDTRDKKYKLIEINPRLWGSIMLSEFCNANFIRGYVSLCQGITPKFNGIKINRFIRWIFPYDLIFWLKKPLNPFVFFRRKKNTCYINFSYSSYIRSIFFVLSSYFNSAKILKLLNLWKRS